VREGTCPHVTEKLFVQIAAFKLGKLVVIVLEKRWYILIKIGDCFQRI